MNIRFEATEIGCEDDEYALVCGASNSKSESVYHYMIIQGCSEPDDEDDEGIHFSIDDQIDGNYDLLDICEVTRQQIIFTLHKDVPWCPSLRQVIADCSSTPDSDFDALIAGLRRFFRDRPADLVLSA